MTAPSSRLYLEELRVTSAPAELADVDQAMMAAAITQSGRCPCQHPHVHQHPHGDEEEGDEQGVADEPDPVHERALVRDEPVQGEAGQERADDGLRTRQPRPGTRRRTGPP
jgi:hypothetical protein